MGTISLSDYEDVRIWVPWGHISGRWYGNRKDRPILAIHGWMDNLGTFDKLIPLLPDYLGVLCIDLPGHGHSSRWPTGIPYAEYDSFVLVIGRIMKEYKWPKVSLMCHSIGGVISFIHTSLAPHTVDFVIAIDGVMFPVENLKFIKNKKFRIEKFMEEEERNARGSIYEPKSYTLDNLSNYLSSSTYQSVPKELAHHVLNRAIVKSELYPDKVYVAKDNRVKYGSEFLFQPKLCAEMARRIKNKPFLILKGSGSPFVAEKDAEVISILRNQNPHFEYYEVDGLHHIHLANAEECAKYIVPFLKRHRPPLDKESSLKKLQKL